MVVSSASLAILCNCILALLWPLDDAGAQGAPPAEVTEFIEQLKDGAFDAARSLAANPVLYDPEMQAAAVPALIEILQGDDPGVSAVAAEALGRIGAAAAAAAPVLTDIIDTEPEGALRTAAVMARARIAEALERQRTYVRFEDGLLTVRADDARLGAVLKEISRRAFIAVEFGAGVADRRIAGEVSEQSLSEGLRLLLADYDLFTYHRGGKGLLTIWVYAKLAGRGLYPIPPEMWASTEDMESQLRDFDPEARISALENLIGRNAAEAGRYVIEALGDDDDRVRATALDQARTEGIALPPARLWDLATTDPSHNVRFLALQNLRGDPTEEWVAEEMLSDPNPVLRSYAEQVLNRLYPPEAPEESGQQTQ